MTYKIVFSAMLKEGGGFLMNPKAIVEADSITDAEKKFLGFAKTRLEKYDVEVISIAKSDLYLVK